MLTLDKLKDMESNTIFASGVANDPRLYAEPVRWIAVRGEIEDWAIYYHLEIHNNDYISKHGDKCCTKAMIRELVPCDDEVFAMYRY